MIELSIYRERIGRFHGGRSSLKIAFDSALEKLLANISSNPVFQISGGSLGGKSSGGFNPRKYLTEQYHFEIVTNPGRGLCGYVSIADALGLDAYTVMHDLAEFISNNPAFYTMFPPGNPQEPVIPHSVYVETLRRLSQTRAGAVHENYWVSNLHLYCVPHIYGVEVNVFCFHFSEWKWIPHKIKPGILERSVGNIYILHSGDHYEWLKVNPGTVVPTQIPHCNSILNGVQVNVPEGFPLPVVRNLGQTGEIALEISDNRSKENVSAESGNAGKVSMNKDHGTVILEITQSEAEASHGAVQALSDDKESHNHARQVQNVAANSSTKPKKRRKKPLTRRKGSKAIRNDFKVVPTVDVQPIRNQPSRDAKNEMRAVSETSKSSFDSFDVLSGILASMPSDEAVVLTPSNLVSSENGWNTSSQTNRCMTGSDSWDSERKRLTRASNTKQRQKERCNNTQYKCVKRKDTLFRGAERLSDAESKRRRRIDSEFSECERKAKESKRTCPEFREAERKVMESKRTCPEFRESERKAMESKRTCPEFREAERKAMESKRTCPEFKEAERKAMESKRTYPEFREAERKVMESKRTCPEFREAERKAMESKRTCPEFRYSERLHDKESKQKVRAELDVRMSRRLKSVEYRKNPEVKLREKTLSQMRRISLSERARQRQLFRDKYRRPEFRQRFLHLKNLVQRRHRMDPLYNPKKVGQIRGNVISASTLVRANLSRLMRELKTVHMPCVSCHRLMFPAQRVFLSDRVVSGLVDSGGYFCHTCAKQLKKGRKPSWHYKNFFDGHGIFPKIKPNVASLNWMEERLLAVSHAFLKLQMPYSKLPIPLGTGRDRGGYRLVGSVVLVPHKVSSTWRQILPRCADDVSIHTIDLKTRIVLNRRLADDRPYEEGLIDIKKMKLAAEELSLTPVYENVTFDEERFQQLNSFEPPCESEFVDNCNFEDIELSDDDCPNSQAGTERTTGTKYTLLVKNSEQHQNIDPSNKQPRGFGLEGCESLKLAPTEHGKPVSLKNIPAFYECFPTIFMGENRLVTTESLKVDFATVCKLMLMNKETRLSKRYEALFLLYRIKQYLLLEGKIWLYLSKTKTGANLTAGLCKAGIPALQEAEVVTSFLEATRNSPAYWSRKKAEIFAFIRQLGRPTFFITFSANECFWAPLYVLLKRTDGGNFFEQSDHQFDKFMVEAEHKIRRSVSDRGARSEIRQMVQKDPTTTCRYLFYRFRKVLGFLKSNSSIIGKVKDYFVRVEYQQRGMPHFHCLFFTDNDPAESADWNDRTDSEKAANIVEFVDKVSTCHLPPEKPDGIESVRIFQFHKCYQNLCYKKNIRGPGRKLVCRFGFPRPPMKMTMVLTPLKDGEFSESHRLWLKTCHDEVFSAMAKLPKDEKLCALETTFEEFLNSLHMQENDYINCLRLSLSREKVFLKRKLCEARINNYSPDLLKGWYSNMDISYCENVYAVARYLTDYLTKSARGVSSLMRQLMRELAKNPELNALQKMNRIRDKFMGSTEIPLEECVVDLCQLPYVFTSRGTARINTHTENERVRVRKRYAELQKLDDDSTDVFQESVIDKYVKRPKVLENICLAEYVALYHNALRKENQRPINNKELGNIDDVCDHDIIHNDLDEPIETTESGIKKRQLPRVLLYHIQKESVDADSFYRQHLLLFKNFRDEKTEIDSPHLIGPNKGISARRSQFEYYYTEILENRKKFHHGLSSLRDTALDVQELINEEQALDQNSTHAERETDCETRVEPAGSDLNATIALETDVGKPGNAADADNMQDESSAMMIYKIPGMLTDSEYTELLLSLNELQRKFMFDLAHRIVDRDEQVLAYLAGMAGTGKSRFIFALQQCISRFIYHGQDVIVTLPTAFTGIAAVNLEGGVTLHSAFSLPLHTRQGESLKPLNFTFSKKLADKYAHLVLLIIDEISMVSSTMLQNIDTRLRLLRGVDRLFGGISVLCVGDFNQLKPVCAPPVYQLSGDPYARIFNNLWSHFVYFELTECMRVNREEKQFSIALNKFGKRCLDSKALEIFNQCIVTEQRPTPLECVHLFGTNEEVDLHNKERILMARAKSPSWESIALDQFKDNRKKAMKAADEREIAEKVSEMPLVKTGNLASHLILVKGLRYMVTKNISVGDKIANGSVGLCFHACKNNDGTLVAYLKFADPSVGGNKYKGKKIDLCNTEVEGLENCVIVKPIQNAFQVCSGISCTRFQVPLVPAMAITIHKSQGQTERGPLCFHPSSKMTLSSYYVALSRVTSQKNLFIDVSKTGYFRPPSGKNDDASSVIELMSVDRPYRFGLEFIEDDDCVLLRIGYHNCNSVSRYSSYISNDRSFKSCDVLCFVESKAKSRSDVPLNDFLIAAHVPSSSAKTVGSRVYVKHYLWQNSTSKLIFEKRLPCRGKAFVEITVVKIFQDQKNIVILNIYKYNHATNHQACSVLRKAFRDCLSDTSNEDAIIVVGDFNVGSGTNFSDFDDFFHEVLGVRRIIDNDVVNTTKGKTSIDSVYSRSNDSISTEAKVFWTPFNTQYHCPLMVKLKLTSK